MATINREIRYSCADDCVREGCPTHSGSLTYQSVSDAYTFVMNGRELSFERGELEAMLALLASIKRWDSVQVPDTLIAAPTSA